MLGRINQWSHLGLDSWTLAPKIPRFKSLKTVHVTLSDNRYFTEMTKYLRCRDYSGLFKWTLNVITSVLIKGRQRLDLNRSYSDILILSGVDFKLRWHRSKIVFIVGLIKSHQNGVSFWDFCLMSFYFEVTPLWLMKAQTILILVGALGTFRFLLTVLSLCSLSLYSVLLFNILPLKF